MIGKLLKDLIGISRVSGVSTAIRWAGCVARTMPTALRTRNLLAADRAMGTGPFQVRSGSTRARLVGEQAFSGLREVWVRSVYSEGNFLRIPDHGLVVDLGANMGNFSVMALAANPTARLIAVEPSARGVAKWQANIRANGFDNRATICRAFVGRFTAQQDSDVSGDPHYADVERLDEADFITRYGIERIAFLKCDIEGSEYFLADPDSRLLDMTDRLGIELHAFGGDVQAFLDMLVRRGFRIHVANWDGPDCIALAVRQA